MKIIALVPVKNEEWILPTYISSMKKIADEIIVLDDNSTDSTPSILKEHNITVISPLENNQVDMSAKRIELLEEGRKRGGTHFIWLDADESFNTEFLKNGRKRIEKLAKGQKLSLAWITLWKSTNQERLDSVWKENYKDVIVCDSPEYTFEKRTLSEGRTQGPNTDLTQVSKEEGVILHFQFTSFNDAQAKQAWYRCIELSEKKKSARRINHTYSIGLETPEVIVQNTPQEWFTDIEIPKQESNKASWYIKEIRKMFDAKGILFFEALDIWHIPELNNTFVSAHGHQPKPKRYPKWLIILNAFKNSLKK